MSSFTSPLIVSPLPDGKNWRLIEEFDYHLGAEDSPVFLHVPAGFVTDFASIPKWLWFLPWWATFSKAPVLHDWLYHVKQLMGGPITRKTADEIFLEAMLIDWRDHPSRYVMARVEYVAVRLFAWIAWMMSRKGGYVQSA